MVNAEAAAAHGKRLHELVERARAEYVERGTPVPEWLWQRMDEAAADLAGAL